MNFGDNIDDAMLSEDFDNAYTQMVSNRISDTDNIDYFNNTPSSSRETNDRKKHGLDHSNSFISLYTKI